MTAAAVRIDRTVIAMLIIGLGLGTWAIQGYLPIWLLGVAAAIAIWRWRLTAQGRSPPSTRVRTVAGLILAAALIATGNVGLGLEAAIPLFISFLWLKLLEVYTERDLGMTAGLGSFLAGAVVLLDQSLLQMLIGLVSITLIWASVHAARLPVQGGRWRQSIRRSLVLSLQALPVAAVLFLLVPRPSIRINLQQGTATSGISDHLKPGMIANLAINQSVAFRATFDGPLPPVEHLYWRGIVLPVTDGIGWYRDNRGRGLGGPPKIVHPGDDPAYIHRIDLLPHGRTWLYALDPPVGFDAIASPRPGSELSYGRTVTSSVSYRITSHPRREAADGDRITLARATLLPEELDPRLGQLAATWQTQTRERGGRIDDLITVIDQWFADQGFRYTLEPGAMDGDPNADFLFTKRAGFCSHYATAVALLARLQGVPSRVVMGYRGGEWNDPGGFLVVRNAHAHAWCELFDADTESWRRYDPTAAVTAEQTEDMVRNGGAAGDPANAPNDLVRAWRQMRQWWDWIDAGWQQSMYAFDSDFQLRIAEGAGLGEFGKTGLLISAGVAALLVVGALAILLRRRPPRADLAQRLYLGWRRRLAARGCPDDPAEPPLAFARRAEACFPDRAVDISAITQAYLESRYGADPDPQARALRHALRSAGAWSART